MLNYMFASISELTALIAAPEIHIFYRPYMNKKQSYRYIEGRSYCVRRTDTT